MLVGIHFPGGAGGHYIALQVLTLLGVGEPDTTSTGHCHTMTPIHDLYQISSKVYDRCEDGFIEDVERQYVGGNRVYMSHVDSLRIHSSVTDKHIIITTPTAQEAITSAARQFYKVLSFADERSQSFWESVDGMPKDVYDVERQDLEVYCERMGANYMSHWASSTIDHALTIEFNQVDTVDTIHRIAEYLNLPINQKAINFAELYSSKQKSYSEILDSLYGKIT